MYTESNEWTTKFIGTHYLKSIQKMYIYIKKR